MELKLSPVPGLTVKRKTYQPETQLMTKRRTARIKSGRPQRMCRNIKILFNFEPPVTDEEIRAASLQFVRKISGFNEPSKANEESFMAAVEEIAGISRRLLDSL